MATPFQNKIRQAIKNENLQIALDNNARRRKQARLKGYTSLPEDIEVMRQRAHSMRADVIANLAHYVDTFAKNAEKNGIVVHKAANSAEAVRIVLEIAQRQKARLIAKSKTMVGEEIHINEALEEAGIEVIETDLGEYIIQLRKEPPGHIITPAVHLRRADVGQTFNEKLGLPLTEDVDLMTAAARKALRQVFLNADIGISGVNVGVVENGMLVLLTNEGNGRMVTNLPRVHIALMGIERLAPTLDDLALVLYLLPRSATGQKLTVYANFVHGPRRPGEPDGPEERHVILLDNGRSAISKSPLQEALFCVRCGACMNSCPVFQELGGHAYVDTHGQHSIYPGPLGAVLTPSLFAYKDFAHLARACSLCGACKDACPVATDFPHLILNVKSGETVQGPTQSNAPGYMKLAMKFFAWIATSPKLFAAAQRSAGLFSRLISPRDSIMWLPAITRWGTAKDIARPAVRPFRDRFSSIQGKGRANEQMISPLNSVRVETAPPPTEPSIPLREQFYQELVKVGANFKLCTPENLARRVTDVLKEKGIDRIQAWDEQNLPQGLFYQLREAGIQIVLESDPSIVAGLTGATGGIAESGTLLVPGGPGKPLPASLLPEIHLAVVYERDLVESIPEALQSPSLYQASAAVLITGPSRTADIEMTMSIGMHGPRELYVFCISETK